MNNFDFSKMVQTMTFISFWLSKALMDKRVTTDEGAELVKNICNIWELPAYIDFEKKEKENRKEKKELVGLGSSISSEKYNTISSNLSNEIK